MPADEILIAEADIQSRLSELAAEINEALPEGPVHVVMILKGAIIFGVDLARALMRNTTLGFLTASSYGEGTQSSGKVEIDARHLGDLEGRNVLLIDDILDTGHTFAKTIDILKSKRPASLRTCVLMDKPARRETEIQADHVGFTIDNHFVVGYGLDCDEAFRTLPDIRIYAPE
ncbi:MAG: hypoxanthine phosphoribosyltransferase [Nitrospinae bacterium]|nr:hypoxanthine phosphoribosyltransferase [Nitrospinota bacterium]